MSAVDNTSLVHRLYDEGISQGKLTVFDELVASDCSVHPLWFNPVAPASVSTVSTPEMMKSALTRERQLFPDLQVMMDEMLDAGDRVIVRWTQQGTYKNGEHVNWQGLTIYRIADGKIVEQWDTWDRLGFWQQLGVVPRTDQLLETAGI